MRTIGAGPFFYSENVPLGEMTSGGAPATFDHSSAIGQLGDTRVEFMVVHGAWAVNDFWDLVVDTLEREGAPIYMQARFSTMQTSYHDASHLFGHHVEVHHRTSDFGAFFGMVRDASRDWDGSDPFRAVPL